MKKWAVLFLIISFFSNSVLAYSIKVYNRQGKLVGKAVKNGSDITLYNLEGKKIETKEQLYLLPGVPIKNLNMGTNYKIENFKYEKF